MFSRSKQRIYPLEDVPGAVHHPGEATAQSCCEQLPSMKMDCGSCNNARFIETTMKLVFSIYAERWFILVMTGGRRVLKSLSVNLHSLLSLRLVKKKELGNITETVLFFSFQKLTPFNFYAKFIAAQNISETALLLSFPFRKYIPLWKYLVKIIAPPSRGVRSQLVAKDQTHPPDKPFETQAEILYHPEGIVIHVAAFSFPIVPPCICLLGFSVPSHL